MNTQATLKTPIDPNAPLRTPMRQLICGIDPGLHGAVAFYDTHAGELHAVHDLPTQKTANGKKHELDLPSLGVLIDSYAPQTLFAVIEEVGARPGQGVTSMFRFGFAAGAVAGCIASSMVPVHYVKPAVWKMIMGLDRDKNKSLTLAKKQFPNHAHMFKRKMDADRAEASLLAFFGDQKILPVFRKKFKS
jgi:crossover junction endodeoxyribonuclease RuvC